VPVVREIFRALMNPDGGTVAGDPLAGGVRASALARGLELEHCPDDLLILRLLTELPGYTRRDLLAEDPVSCTRTAIPVLKRPSTRG